MAVIEQELAAKRLGRPFLKRFQRWIRWADFVVIVVSIAIGLALGWGYGGELTEDTRRQFFSVAILVVWPVMLWQKQTTQPSILGRGFVEYRRVVTATMWMVAVVAMLAYFSGNDRGRYFFVGVAALGLGLLLLERNIARRLLHRQLRQTEGLHRVFVAAPGSRLSDIEQDIARSDGRFVTVGHMELETGQHPRDVVHQAEAAGADTILLIPSGDSDPKWTRRLGWAMEDTDLSLMVSAGVMEIAGPRLSIEPVEATPYIWVEMPTFSGPTRVLKRTLDVVGTGLGLLVLAIPMLLLAAAIRMESAGPALFKQRRAGRGDSTFLCWKFRTMYQDADELRDELRAEAGSDSATFKMADDPRVTRIGGILRRFSIDELPQLVNVLRGDMSLVGPRPHPLDDVQRYDDLAIRRLRARPGMTGLWQVSGRSDLSWDESVRLDLYYVENWSLTLDLIILASTMKAVITGRGAY